MTMSTRPDAADIVLNGGGGYTSERAGGSEEDSHMPAASAGRFSFDEISLFVDADGTLLDIAPAPDQAIADRNLLDLLERAKNALGGALAIVSGRRIEDLDRLFAPLMLPASGIHGAQMRLAAGGPIVVSSAPQPSPLLRDAVRAAMTRYPGVLIEDKGKALAVHWRNAPEQAPAIYEDIVRIVGASAERDLTILQGHCVFEIKAASTDKGEAVRAFMRMEPFAGRKPIFVGDDMTDIPAFAAARALGGRAFAVGAPLPEAEGYFDDPKEVRAWLASLLQMEVGGAG